MAETLSDVAKDGRRADGGASPDARRARDAGKDETRARTDE